MRIAVDARPLSPPITGIGVYTRSLLEQMLDSGHDWLLYSDRALADGPWYGHPQATIRHGNAAPRSLASLLHANLHFPRWARRDEAKLFWSPRHHLPFLLPKSVSGVVTVHDLLWRRYPETMPWKGRLLEAAAMASSLRRARHIIAVSEFTGAELAHFYPHVTTPCSVIPEAGRDLGEPEQPGFDFPYFLFVGTVEPRKNIARLLRAFAGFLSRSEYQHRLVIVGASGWGDVDVQRESEVLGISERVVLEGYASDARLAGLYQQAEALVMPSLYEGYGLPVVEAMSRGTPAIVSNRASLPEVAGDGALLVDPESVPSMTEALLSIAGNGELRQGLSSRAILQARRFSWERAATATLSVLESAA